MNNPAIVVKGTYFPHVDGIRAIAVLPVVFYHLWAPLCPGGFMGVDVFFVISGYLITGGILRGLKKGDFTIRDFYHRRIKRILPAYFVMIMGVFVIGCILYYCTPLSHMADAAVMGTLFMANLYFWKTGGDYFAPDIHGNPLLHLWSLGVEEQFYLFIPVLFIVVWKVKKKWLLPVVLLLTVLSFLGAVYAMSRGAAENAFYLPHLRAWELLVGSLLAMVPAALGEKQYCRWLAGAGLILLCVSYAVFSSGTSFPGLTALPPVLGAALLIRYGNSGLAGRLLSLSPLVGIGKISYSLYLWHWPVMVFWKYVTYEQLYFMDYAAMLVSSFVLGYLSWRFVELPVRVSKTWNPKKSFVFSSCGIVILLGIGLSTIFTKGWANVLHKEANQMITYRPDYFIEGLVKNKCRILGSYFGYDIDFFEELPFSMGAQGDFNLGIDDGNAQVMIVGDSHAGALQYGMAEILRKHKRSGIVMSRGGLSAYNQDVEFAHQIVAKLQSEPEIRKVIIAQYWTDGTRYSNPARMYEQLEKFATAIKRMNKKLYILTDVPVYDYNITEEVVKESMFPPRKRRNRMRKLEEYEDRQGELNRNLEKLCVRTGAVLVPIHLALKRGSDYIAFKSDSAMLVPLFHDRNHLSPEGSLIVGEYIYPYLFGEQ